MTVIFRKTTHFNTPVPLAQNSFIDAFFNQIHEQLFVRYHTFYSFYLSNCYYYYCYYYYYYYPSSVTSEVKILIKQEEELILNVLSLAL